MTSSSPSNVLPLGRAGNQEFAAAARAIYDVGVTLPFAAVVLAATLAAKAPSGSKDAAAKAAANKDAAAKDAATRDATAKDVAPKKVLVIELSGLGIDPGILRNLENYLRTSIATIDGFIVISAVDLKIALSEPKNKNVANCGFGPECALASGKLVGADVVVFGSITALGQAFSLNIRALDLKLGKERTRVQATISGSRDLLIPEVRLAAYRLVAPERVHGWLVVDIDVAGVEIEIDGAKVGVTPLDKPIDNLAPGAHVVVIKRPGYTQFQQEFTIKPFEPTRLKLTLGDK